jgi:hypothetical protein
MGIIEEIEKVLAEGLIEVTGGVPDIDGASTPVPRRLLRRAAARLRELEDELEEALAQSYPKRPAEPEAKRPAEPEGPSASSVFLDLTKVVVDLRKRVEALEAREEARGRARAAEEGHPLFRDVSKEVAWTDPKAPEPSFGHCPHDPCCHCTRKACPTEARPGAREFRAELDEDQAFFCEHANECPTFCPCPPNCYCKTRTCAGKGDPLR